MNWSEYVHFTSGAAAADISGQAARGSAGPASGPAGARPRAVPGVPAAHSGSVRRLGTEFWAFAAWAAGVDLMFAEAADWDRPIRFTRGVGGHMPALEVAR